MEKTSVEPQEANPATSLSCVASTASLMTSGVAPSQMNTLPVRPVLSMNTPHLIQTTSLVVSQPQAFTMALNQRQPHPLTPRQTIGVIPQSHQLVGTSIAGQGLSIVSPTLFTGQGQIITSPITQFPIMLANQQGIISSINTVNQLQLPAQGANVDSVVVSGNASLQASTQNTNQVTAIDSPNIVTATSNATTLVTQETLLTANNTTAASTVNTLTTTVSESKSPKVETLTATASVSEANSSYPSSASSSTGIKTITVPSTDIKSSISSGETKLKPVKSLPHPISGNSRMKYTPIDSSPSKQQASISSVDKADGHVDSYCESKQNGNHAGSLSSNEDKSFHKNADASEDGQGDLADVEDLEDSEFVWEDYLKETGATAVSPTAFKHVELSLQSGFSKGMKLEAPNKHSPHTYWVATIVMTCGPLLRLRYEGYDDNSSADFWSDPMTSDIHPLGWCETHGKTMQPPEVIEEKYPEWSQFLSDRLESALKAPASLLDKSTGATPVDQICEGMRLEVQELLRRDCVWVGRVVENVGGRLLLRYECLDKSSHDFWLFYLDECLHPLGWASSKGYSYRPPEAVKSNVGATEENLRESLDTLLKDTSNEKVPDNIFKDQPTIKPHDFEVGMRLEAVDPRDKHSLAPAFVVKVIDEFYFIVKMDSVSSDTAPVAEGYDTSMFGCHRCTPTIFPIKWAANYGIKLKSPAGWDKTDFVWDDYLDFIKAKAAPENLFGMESPEHELECGMKLEAVNPLLPSQIGAATITQKVAHLVWVHLDGSSRPLDSHVASATSLDLLPIGWCVSNGYQLQPPSVQILKVTSQSSPVQYLNSGGDRPRPRAVAVVQPEMYGNTKAAVYTQASNGKDLYGGPQIFFNHRCFSGPYLSKGRIAALPRSVGPGPLTLVMKEVLSLLINTAYKSSRVLRELQLEGKPSSDMIQQTLKAKYKGKSYRAVVEICRNASQLEGFCQDVCLKLECCPNLISPHYISAECPERCDQLTKTKYSYYYGKKKRKIGRPPGGHTNLEDGQQRPTGKRRRKRKIGMMGKQQADGDQEENDDDDKESIESDTKTVDSNGGESKHSLSSKGSSLAEKQRNKRLAIKRRYTHHIPPPSGIRTRGAKLPKYSFEKRTHKKIMLVEGSQQTSKSQKESAKTMQNLSKAEKVKERKENNSANVSSSSSTSSSSLLPNHHQRALLAQRLKASTRGGAPLSLKPEPPLVLDSNPLEWTVTQVADFLATTDCQDQDLIAKLKTEEIDGQALLLLTLPNIQEYLGIKLGPAIKLCHIIERLKIAFFNQFAACT